KLENRPKHHIARMSGARVAVVHVRDDQPPLVGVPPERQRELPDVCLACVTRESADDVADRAFSPEPKAPEPEWSALSRIVAFDLRTSPHWRHAIRKNETVRAEER